ncbi:MAG: oligosaccharide flippase family protein [Chloroflexi bacterium]|nr:oligosaccharide flippase family protein [Chloroflexota bacterium]
MVRHTGTFVYTAAGTLSRLSTLVAQVLLRRAIPPDQFGLWSLTQVIVEFVSSFDLGSVSAIERDLPLERGRQRATSVISLQSSALILVMLQGAISAVAVVLYSLVLGLGGSRDDLLAWGGAAAILLFAPANAAGQAVIRAHGRFDHAGYLGVSIALTSSVCVLGGGLLAGAQGLILGGIAAVIINALSSWNYARLLGISIQVHYISRASVARLLRFGVPMRVADYPTSVFMTADALAVAALYNKETLALYATARTFVAVGVEVASRLTASVRNDWRVRLGRDPSDQSIPRGVFRLLSLQALAVLPCLALAIYLGGEIVTYVLMPQYAGALPILKLLLVGCVFLPPAYGIRDLWVVRADFRALFLTGSGGVLAFGALIGTLSLSIQSVDVQLVALGYVVSSAVYMGVLLATCGRAMWGGPRAALAAGILLAGAALTWSVLELATLPVGWDLRLGADVLVATALRSLLLLLLPLGWTLAREWPALKAMRSEGRSL